MNTQRRTERISSVPVSSLTFQDNSLNPACAARYVCARGQAVVACDRAIDSSSARLLAGRGAGLVMDEVGGITPCRRAPEPRYFVPSDDSTPLVQR